MHKKASNLLKNAGIALVCAIAVSSVIFCSFKIRTIADDAGLSPHKTTVVIDAGHGGIDGGVSGISTGVKESFLNLEYSKCLYEILSEAGFDAVLTRPTGAGLYGTTAKGFKKRDMKKRKEIIEKANADLVVSVHMNYCEIRSRRSAQTFYKKGHAGSERLAFCVQGKINEMTETVKKTSPLVGDYYILNCTEIPSVLVECGFLSNTEDERLLLTEEYRLTLCYAIYTGIASFLANK